MALDEDALAQKEYFALKEEIDKALTDTDYKDLCEAILFEYQYHIEDLKIIRTAFEITIDNIYGFSDE